MGASNEKPKFYLNKKLEILTEKEQINHYLNNKIIEIIFDKENSNIKDNSDDYIIYEIHPTIDFFDLKIKYSK
jgi:hypothetical protein